jgi:uncharacterized repeat protein (TIGR02543 family)
MVRKFHLSDSSDWRHYVKPGALGLILLTFSLVMTTLIATPQIAVGANESCYTVTDGVADNGGSCTGSLVIGEGVTAIASGGFQSNELITSLVLPSTLESIGSEAFAQNRNLTSITFAATSSLTSIGNAAFYGAEALKSLTIPNSVETIGESAFFEVISLESLTIPNSIIDIPDNAFYAAKSLKSLTIPNSVKTIGESAFAYAEGLRFLSLGSGLTSLGVGAFSGNGLSCFAKSADSLAYEVIVGAGLNPSFENGACATEVPQKPTGVQLIRSYPNFVLYFDTPTVTTDSPIIQYDYVIQELKENSKPLQDTFVSTVSPLEISGLRESRYLIQIRAVNSYGVSELSDPVASSCYTVYPSGQATDGGSCTGDLILHSSVTGIDRLGFENAEITSIKLPEGVLSIGLDAFQGNTKLRTVLIPKSVSFIEPNPFDGAEALESIEVDASNDYYKDVDGVLFNKVGTTLFAYANGKKSSNYVVPATVDLIEAGAFSETLLSEVTIPANVSAISEKAFSDSAALRSISFMGNAPAVGQSAFTRVAPGATAYILPGATGFTTPTWNGLNVSVLPPKVVVPVIPTYIVSYSGNSDDATSLPQDYNGYISNQKVALSSQIPQRTGYTFTGWNTVANAGGTAYSTGDSLVMNSSNITLYAQWTLNSYTLSFSPNGGPELRFAPQIREYQSVGILPVIEGDSLRTGYSFVGWNSAADGSGASYAALSLFRYPAINTTLHAQWKINSYTVAYDGNGVQIGRVPKTLTYLYNSPVTVKSQSRTFIRRGYVFQGWNTAKDGSGSEFATDEEFVMGGSNLILYANWVPNTYQVKFFSTMRYLLAKAHFTTGGFVSIPPTPAGRSGYTFKGWSLSPSSNQIISFPYSPKVTRNHVLYAIWEKNK